MYANLAQLWDPTWPPKSIEKLSPKCYNVFLSGPNWVPKTIEKLAKTAGMRAELDQLGKTIDQQMRAGKLINKCINACLTDTTWVPKPGEKLAKR